MFIVCSMFNLWIYNDIYIYTYTIYHIDNVMTYIVIYTFHIYICIPSPYVSLSGSIISDLSRDRVSEPWMLWDKWKFVTCGSPDDLSTGTRMFAEWNG